jgi:hypothetical protein
MPARPQSARSEASSSCASSTAWSPPDDQPKFLKPPPRLSARPFVPGAASFRMKESQLLRGSLTFKLTEDRAVHRLQEHIGVDRKRRSELALDPGKYDIRTMGTPTRPTWPDAEGAGVAYARTQRPKRDARAFSISYSPAMDKTTLYESTFAPPHRKSVSARDRFGKTEPGARLGLYCVHAPSRGGPDFGTYNFASSFAKPRPSLSRSMRIVISRTATGEFMPVEAQKPVEAKKTYGISPRSADQRRPRAATSEPPRARPASARA